MSTSCEYKFQIFNKTLFISINNKNNKINYKIKKKSYYEYIDSIISEYCFETTFLLTFKVGPSSPVGIEKS